MTSLKYLFVILTVVTLCNSVRINMQGSVSLGKEVLETLSHYMKKNAAVINRRSMAHAGKDIERIKWTIQSANICRGLQICNGPLGDFIKEYIYMLASAVESIFEGVISSKSDREYRGAVFSEDLKPVLHDINDLLKTANDKIAQEKFLFEWVTIVKKIGAKYQKAVINFVSNRLDGDPQDIQTVKKKLVQKLVLALVIVENKYENKMCVEHHICEKEHECTKALDSMLEEFENIPNDKSIEFIKYFYENVPDQAFAFLGVDSAHELQVVLSDLSYSKDAPAKDVLISVYKAVEARLKYLRNNTEALKYYDQQLVHAILSDMDYFYFSKRKTYPFDNFLGPFIGWLRLGGRFHQQMKQVLKEIKKKLDDQDPELIDKISNEVRVFLELTVAPEN